MRLLREPLATPICNDETGSYNMICLNEFFVNPATTCGPIRLIERSGLEDGGVESKKGMELEKTIEELASSVTGANLTPSSSPTLAAGHKHK